MVFCVPLNKPSYDRILRGERHLLMSLILLLKSMLGKMNKWLFTYDVNWDLVFFWILGSALETAWSSVKYITKLVYCKESLHHWAS